jgi:hypothetical protein
VDHVQAALCRLADAPPATAAARAATAQVDEDWTRRPHVVAVTGRVEARTALVNYLFGGELLDPVEQALRSVPLRIRRARDTAFVVHGKKGSETFPLAQPSRAAKTDMLELQQQLQLGEATLFQIDTTATQVLQAPPPRWKAWLWPLHWLRARRAHAQLAKRPKVEAEVRETREKLATLFAETTDTDARTLVERTDQIARLRACCSRADVGEIELLLAEGPLPHGVELHEHQDAPADAVVAVTGERVHVPGEPTLTLGTRSEVIAMLPALLASARALDIARRFGAKIQSALDGLDGALERKDATLRARIEKLEALRVTDPEAFCAKELARAQPRIEAAVNAVLEHAQVRLRHDLGHFAAEMIGHIDRATSGDALKALVGPWQEATRRIAQRVQAQVSQGLAASLTGLRDELLGALVARGLPRQYAERVDTVAAPEVAILPSLAAAEIEPLDETGWLGGLFRSLDTRRAQAIEAARDRWQALSDRAPIELREAGPALLAAIRALLADQLADAAARHSAWIDEAIVAEREDIEREREAGSALVRVRDAARHDLALLGEQVAKFEQAHAALAAAVPRPPA